MDRATDWARDKDTAMTASAASFTDSFIFPFLLLLLLPRQRIDAAIKTPFASGRLVQSATTNSDHLRPWAMRLEFGPLMSRPSKESHQTPGTDGSKISR